MSEKSLTNHPIEDYAAAIYNAIARDLPLVTTREKDFDAWSKLSIGEKKLRQSRINKGDQTAFPKTIKKRHPYISEVDVTSFSQNWPTSAMGFANEGRPEETSAYTVVVEHGGAYAVYFAGRYAYLVMGIKDGMPRRDSAWRAFLQNLADRKLRGCKEAAAHYHAVRINQFGSNMRDSDEEKE